MPTPEEIHESLKALKNPHYQQDQLKRIQRLRGRLATLGQILIRSGPEWDKVANDRSKLAKAQQEMFDQLGKLNARDRQKLFQALLPTLQPYVEATWTLFDKLPYQTEYYRRPFRNPRQPSSAARINWLYRLLWATRDYDQEISWFAAWAPYLQFGGADMLGYLFAGAIEAGGKTGQEVFDILIASGSGSHEIGLMGRHVVRGLLCASRPEGWDFIERLLLAAQREEGLRQVILESVDEAQPQAFQRLLRVILDHNLSRFSAAVRAFDVWFGLALETVPQRQVNTLLQRILAYLEDPKARQKAVQAGTAEEAYFALWAMAFEDAAAALPHAIEVRQSPDLDRRFAATHLLAQLGLVGSFQELLIALDDPDLIIAARAFTGLQPPAYSGEFLGQSDLFEHLERLIARLPHKENSWKSPVWDWLIVKLSQQEIAGRLIECLGSRSSKRLIPYLGMMTPDDRSRVARLLNELDKKDAETRQVLLTLAADPSRYVRESALAAIQGFKLTEAEAQQLEGLLVRKAEDLRRGVIQLLLELPDQSLMAAAARLLGQKNANQRRAGLEMLRVCIQADRCVKESRRLASEFARAAEPQGVQARLLEDILAGETETFSLEDALGLMDPGNRTRPQPPPGRTAWPGKKPKTSLGSPAAVAVIQALEALVEKHRTEPVGLTFWDTERTELLGNVRHGFPTPDPSLPLEQDLERLPLRQVWEAWWQTRPETQRDADGLELPRAMAVLGLFQMRWVGPERWAAEMPAELQGFYDVRGDFRLNYQAVIGAVLQWLIRAFPHQAEVSFLVEALEASISRIPGDMLTGLRELYAGRVGRVIPTPMLSYLELCRWHRSLRPEAWQADHHARLWQVVRWLDQPKPGLPRFYPHLEDALYAWRAGAATRDDLLDMLLGPREAAGFGYQFNLLRQLSGRKPHPAFQEYPELKELVEACRERILAVETRRGDLPTAATAPAIALRSIPGMQPMFRILAALGKTGFARGYHMGASRQAALSHLIRVAYPVEADTHSGFAELVRQYQISDRRLVELAVYAPQWAGYVEHTLGWPKLQEAVFWVYAHTKDRRWVVETEIRELWTAQVSEYTPLSADSLMDGAVDVDWFHRVYNVLGEERWQAVYRVAELTATGNGHVRARLFADAMLGRATAPELIERITKKRHQDAVRALGLVPLPDGVERQAEVSRRYEVMQEFLRTTKKYGSQRQASEKLAAAIGMENLARNAGYADPQRLEWAMEIEAVSELASGPIVVEAQGTRITLSINPFGEPEIAIEKDGKPLKAIPARVKKDPQVAEILERRKNLDRQTSRMRQSLEEAMCRGDTFTGSELRGLFRHPMLRAMLEQLLFIGLSGMGYPTKNGMSILDHSGQLIPVKDDETLRIAHPVDLLESGDWHLWQRECFLNERIQPFKQVFRELYVLTPAEKEERNISRRYAGQQVNPRQALALFGRRAWVTDPEEGVHKTFHKVEISARVGFLQGIFTPAEVEGLTLETVAFTRRGDWRPLVLEEIPPRVFSEVMRDLDLVVSVAHAGGVDPEASASSIQARESLVKETCTLLNLSNVQVKDRHVLINGKLGNYTIHLGSAVVHKQPGGALCIIPVHAQQRGRLFLPFVDNDPKSAEVVSKVILLANDRAIKDPTILEQILS